MTLTILCVTELGEHSGPFREQMRATAKAVGGEYVEYDGRGAGCIEHVLDQAINWCKPGYILRLDDDESCSPALVDWLADGQYLAADHWCFPRLHLWPTVESFITSHSLYPDLQTRLSVKEKAGGRAVPHQPSPHGAGRCAAAPIVHHKFLVKPREERQRILDGYEEIQAGAGSNFRAFSLPETLTDVQTSPVTV